MKSTNILFYYILILFFALGISTSHAYAQPKYEFRAVWIATLENIDWPSKRNLSVDEQKAEFIRILDMHHRNGMNAVFVQIRPAADAFYPSQFEPWSEYLNGKQGLAPVPYYDPLQFMIEETHKRAMEFHAWLNPYRAVFNIYKSSVSPTHVTRTHPEWFFTYGDKKYFNPGEPAVVNYITNLVKDLVQRYDVDGVHMDDYFYPYKIANRDFPDDITFRKYGRGLSKAEWRRANCDSVVKSVHDIVFQTKPWVKFGISPFGVWRNSNIDPAGSDTRAGLTNYDDLYADILLWLRKGWIDYVAPQLYWEIGHHLCDYETLLEWWTKHTYGKHLYVGHGVYRVFENPTKPWRNPNELPNQIKLLRDYPEIQGSAFFSSKNFERNPNGWSDSLRFNYYKYPAIIPPMPWIDSTQPAKPIIVNARNGEGNFKGQVLKIDAKQADGEEDLRAYVVYIADDIPTLGQHPRYIFSAFNKPSLSVDIFDTDIPKEWNNCYIAITCLSTENVESPLSNVVQYVKTNKGWMARK